MNNENYIVIQWWMIKQLKLSWNELLLYALIWGYSQDWESEFKGSLSYIVEALNITKQTVLNIGKTLIDKEYIIKNVKEWIAYYKVNIELVNKLDPPSLKIRQEVVKNLDTIYINNNNIISKDIITADKTTKKEKAENIYKEYYKRLPDNKKQYVKKSQTILYLEALLKEYTEEQLLTSIKHYFNKTDKIYIKAPQYFFSNTKKWKDYRIFEQWIKEEDVPKKPEVNPDTFLF